MKLLEVQDLDAGYGRIMILHGITLHVEAGEIVCLIGPNGAGKSTVLRTIAGQLTPTRGEILVEGDATAGMNPQQKGTRGLIFIPQGQNIFPSLTVAENLEMAGYLLTDRETLKDRMEEVFAVFPWIGERRSRSARELSGGQRQMLALSRVLLMKPKLVLLDEPSLGLAPLMVEEIFDRILAMNRQGISFLLVEQNARKGLSVSHRGYVIEQGKNRLHGAGSELLVNPEVQKLYLGG
ncbi:MAG: ABC transporter ATP-binding protein [Desulfoferrobacter sp.]